ncbi:MAG: VWA domain-containing protein [Gemmatimonadetes bacterium]|nr:VWA domain-containing protein [Gemmatimonadota bacterium]
MRIEFVRPDYLYLLALLPLWAVILWPRVGRGVLYTRGAPPGRHVAGADLGGAFVLLAPRFLTGGALGAVIIAVAAPERVDVTRDTILEGHGMALVLDLSSSMLAEDMGDRQSRIEVARDAGVRFARRRVHDELMLVGFGSDALTRVPPTTDMDLVVHGVESLETQLVRDGTDISGAVLAATARLLESEREPRVIVLLTDGAHNGTELPPLATARAAESLGIRIHAISILAPETAPVGRAAQIIQERFGSERETVLMRLAAITGGQYYRATNAETLDSIYAEIDRIEAPIPRIVEDEVRTPLAFWFFMLALVLLAVEGLLRGSRWGVVH